MQCYTTTTSFWQNSSSFNSLVLFWKIAAWFTTWIKSSLLTNYKLKMSKRLLIQRTCYFEWLIVDDLLRLISRYFTCIERSKNVNWLGWIFRTAEKPNRKRIQKTLVFVKKCCFNKGRKKCLQIYSKLEWNKSSIWIFVI